MSRLLDRRNARKVNVNGLRRDPRTGAGKLAKSERGYGGVLAFDFTDNSAAIYDPTTQANVAYSQGVTDGNGNFRGVSSLLTYTSPSNKLTLQSDGFLKYQAHNLYLNSAAPANQSITVVSGASYAVTITGTVSVTASGAATGTWTAGTNTFTAATTTLTLGSTSGSGTVHVRRTPSNDDYIETAGAAKYALPLEYDTSGNCLGLLVEEQRTNVWLNSRTQSGANVGVNALLNSGITTSVFNDTTHKVINENATTADRFFYYRNITGLTSSGQYCVSVVSKAVDRDYISLSMRPGAASNGYRALFNLATGAFVSEGSVGAGLTSTGYGIEDVGNGWYRVYITANIGANTNCYFEIGVSSSASPSYVSNMAYYNGTAGTDAIEVDQTQVELGAFPTSPIITYGAAATRAADQIPQLTSTFPLSATAGSFYAYVTPYAGADLAGIVSLNDGSGNEEIVIYKDASANILAQVEDGGANQLAPLDSTVNASSGTAFKVALAWAANDFALSADGTAAQTDVGGTLPTVTTLEIGVDQANNYFNGIIKAISYVPRRKSDAELAAETA